MAKSKEDIKPATAQAKLSEDESLRVRYKHGTPLEGGKIADSSPVDLFSSAHQIQNSTLPSDSSVSAAQQSQSNPVKAATTTADSTSINTTSNA